MCGNEGLRVWGHVAWSEEWTGEGRMGKGGSRGKRRVEVGEVGKRWARKGRNEVEM